MWYSDLSYHQANTLWALPHQPNPLSQGPVYHLEGFFLVCFASSRRRVIWCDSQFQTGPGGCGTPKTPGRHSMGSIGLSGSFVLGTNLSSCFTVSGFNDMAVEAKDRGLSNLVITTLLKAQKCISHAIIIQARGDD